MVEIVIPKYISENEAFSGLASIGKRLDTLRGYETDRRDPEVEKAVLVIREILEPCLPWFEKHGIVITYHGSLQYNDPRNLDVDLGFISLDKPWEVVWRMDKYLEDSFVQQNVWPRENCITDMTWLQIRDIAREAAIYTNLPYRHDDRDNHIVDLTATLVMTSALLDEKQRPLYRKYRGQVWQIASDSRWLREGIAYILDSVIEEREERRKVA